MPDYRLTIDIKDVAPGDIESLWDQLEDIGIDFDIATGDFTVRVALVDGVRTFEVDRRESL